MRACSNDRRVKPRARRPYPSLNRVPSIFSTYSASKYPHPEPPVPCEWHVLAPRIFLRSSPCRSTAVFNKLLLTVFFTRLSPLGPPFSSHHSPRGILFAVSPGKILLEIYYILHVFNFRELSLPISLSLLSLPLSLFLRSFVKIQYMRLVT